MCGSLMVSYFKVTYWVFVQLPKVKSYLTTVKHLDPISPIWWSQWLSKHELLPLVKVDKNMVRFDNTANFWEVQWWTNFRFNLLLKGFFYIPHSKGGIWIRIKSNLIHVQNLIDVALINDSLCFKSNHVIELNTRSLLGDQSYP